MVTLGPGAIVTGSAGGGTIVNDVFFNEMAATVIYRFPVLVAVQVWSAV